MMSIEEAKKVFLNRGWVEVEGGITYAPEKWREAYVVIANYLWPEQEVPFLKIEEDTEPPIEHHIKQLKKLKSFHNGSYGADINFAINIMRKYEKIKEIMDS